MTVVWVHGQQSEHCSSGLPCLPCPFAWPPSFPPAVCQALHAWAPAPLLPLLSDPRVGSHNAGRCVAEVRCTPRSSGQVCRTAAAVTSLVMRCVSCGHRKMRCTGCGTPGQRRMKVRLPVRSAAATAPAVCALLPTAPSSGGGSSTAMAQVPLLSQNSVNLMPLLLLVHAQQSRACCGMWSSPPFARFAEPLRGRKARVCGCVVRHIGADGPCPSIVAASARLCAPVYAAARQPLWLRLAAACP